jgi:dissimilatory sulfite reductase (desulfoviridin) alpha/beta subunit
MANPKGLVIAFDRDRARDCRSCSTDMAQGGAACDHACPMRLTPRNIKRLMFACVQCGQCITECEASHTKQPRKPNLEWKVGLDAVRETLRQRKG